MLCNSINIMKFLFKLLFQLLLKLQLSHFNLIFNFVKELVNSSKSIILMCLNKIEFGFLILQFFINTYLYIKETFC